ncbi:BLUF domain-containing protein [Mucilaginibacter agri]|uniref:BLUF domain-containing protein n=1 Tax=Mucilaginibacter agri TaxID=2695265 RepID=A0A965ZJZ0_9SPHI|nr:BLUF domain-containing protein [Mucilaginibacter agri]NCD72558.1 hypothetical protein [Mucilaginibacter agri]
MLYYLIYVSKALKLMNDEELAKILTQSRSWNSRVKITGMLLYIKGPTIDGVNGNFIQVLEGEEHDINDLFKKIKDDERHYDVIKLIESVREKRHFQNWQMGFKPLNKKEFTNSAGYFQIEDLYSFKSSHKDFNIPLNYLKSFYTLYFN